MAGTGIKVGGSVHLGLVRWARMLSGPGSERWLWHREATGADGKLSFLVSHCIPSVQGSPSNTGRIQGTCG